MSRAAVHFFGSSCPYSYSIIRTGLPLTLVLWGYTVVLGCSTSSPPGYIPLDCRFFSYLYILADLALRYRSKFPGMRSEHSWCLELSTSTSIDLEGIRIQDEWFHL